jgi:alpha-glucosidase
MQPQTVDFIARIRELMDSYPEKKFTVGEVTESRNDGKGVMPVAASYSDRDKGLDSCYTYVANWISQQAGPENLGNLIREIEKFFPEGGHCLSIGNHDSWRTFARTEGAVAEEHRDAAHKQLMQMFFTLPSSLILYQGEELALPQARIPQDIPVDKLKDITAQTQGMYACRDGGRTPIPWKEKEKNAGFSPSNDPYLPVPGSHYKKAVDVQEKDQVALVKGTTNVLKTQWPILAYVRQSKDQSVLCVFNLSDHKATFKPSDFLDDKALKELSLQDKQPIVLEAYGTSFKGDRPAQLQSAPKPSAPPPIIKKAA